jgi:hypothetical protein
LEDLGARLATEGARELRSGDGGAAGYNVRDEEEKGKQNPRDLDG